jgi:hypothetical protein
VALSLRLIVRAVLTKLGLFDGNVVQVYFHEGADVVS